MELPDQIRAAMVAHARFTFPEEACGLVAADAEGRLRMAYCLTNTERSPVSYTLDPTEHVRAWRHAERNGWHLAGVFHSHTHTAAVPSRTDVAKALEREWVYFVVGLGDDEPDVRAYWITDGEVVEEPLTPPERVPGGA